MRFVVSVLSLLYVTSCGGSAQYSGPWPTKFADSERSRAVEVMTVCIDPEQGLRPKYGSGAILDSRHVVTAKHVAECFEGTTYLTTLVEDSKGQSREAAVEYLGIEADTARLVTKDSEPPFDLYPVRFGVAKTDDVVCASPRIPYARRGCGLVEARDDGRLFVDWPADYGNSGSGAYNANGELVGVVTHLVRCSTGQSCGTIVDTRLDLKKDMKPVDPTGLFGVP